MLTSTSISQFLALQVSGLQGDRISGVLDQQPDLPRQGLAAPGDAEATAPKQAACTHNATILMVFDAVAFGGAVGQFSAGCSAVPRTVLSGPESSR